MNDENTIDLPLQTRADVRLEPETADAAARTIEVVWSTGAAVRRRDLFTGRRYDEVLSLDPGHVDLARLNAGAPLLNAHGAFDLANVLGVVERAWLGQGGDGFEGRAVVRFSEREDVEPFWQDVRAGIIRSVSVGYQVRTYEVSEQDGQPPLWRAIDWVPLELSAVPVGADQAAGFRARQTLAPCHLIHRAAAAQQQETTVMDQTTPAADIRADADSDTPILTSKDAVRRDRPELRCAQPTRSPATMTNPPPRRPSLRASRIPRRESPIPIRSRRPRTSPGGSSSRNAGASPVSTTRRRSCRSTRRSPMIWSAVARASMPLNTATPASRALELHELAAVSG